MVVLIKFRDQLALERSVILTLAAELVRAEKENQRKAVLVLRF